ncbi:MAG: amidohydrolase family protein, partial [Chrysiogenales bacterium]
AYANFLENTTGSIEVGKMADLIVLDKNLFNVPVDEISKVKVILTFFGGKEVFSDGIIKNTNLYISNIIMKKTKETSAFSEKQERQFPIDFMLQE